MYLEQLVTTTITGHSFGFAIRQSTDLIQSFAVCMDLGVLVYTLLPDANVDGGWGLPLRSYTIEFRNETIVDNIRYDFPRPSSLTMLDEWEYIADVSLTPRGITGKDDSGIDIFAQDCAWSPVNAFNDGTCALAVVLNIGEVKVFIREKVFFFKEIYDFRQHEHIHSLRSKITQTFSDYKLARHKATTTCILWTKTFGNRDTGTYSYLILAQKSGDVLFFHIDHAYNKTLTPLLEHTLNLTNSSPASMEMCYASNGTKGCFTVGFLDGTIQLWCVNFDARNLEIVTKTPIFLYDIPDRIRVPKILSYNVEDACVVLAVKRDGVFAALIHESGHKLAQDCLITDDISITDIQPFADSEFVITTHNRKTYFLNVNVNNSTITLSSVEILFGNFDWGKKINLGMVFSRNKCLSFLFTTVPAPALHQLKKTAHRIYLTAFKNDCFNANELLLSNTTQTLTNYWDCLETGLTPGHFIFPFHILRLTFDSIRMDITLQGKDHTKLPWFADMSQLHDGPIYFLRIMLWLHKKFNEYSKIQKTITPTKNDGSLKEVIQCQYCVEKLAKLTSDCDNVHINPKRLYFLLKTVRAFVNSHWYRDGFMNNAAMVIGLLSHAEKLSTCEEIECDVCGVTLTDADKQHPCILATCMFTTSPIFDLSYRVCPICSSAAHKDEEDMLCLYCQVPLYSTDNLCI